jgi:hypothetical protein
MDKNFSDYTIDNHLFGLTLACSNTTHVEIFIEFILFLNYKINPLQIPLRTLMQTVTFGNGPQIEKQCALDWSVLEWFTVRTSTSRFYLRRKKKRKKTKIAVQFDLQKNERESRGNLNTCPLVVQVKWSKVRKTSVVVTILNDRSQCSIRSKVMNSQSRSRIFSKRDSFSSRLLELLDYHFMAGQVCR